MNKLVLPSLVLSGSLALAAGSLFAQSTSEGKALGESVPGTMEPKGNPELGGERIPGQHDADVKHGEKEMHLSSTEIRKVQEALKEKGHNPGSATGEMNHETREAIRAFQQANDLAATGTLDQKTAEKLGVSISGSTGSGARGTSPRSSDGKSSYGSGTESPNLDSGSTGLDANK